MGYIMSIPPNSCAHKKPHDVTLFENEVFEDVILKV